MRTTLDIDRDLLEAAKELAIARKMTTGAVVSALLRQALAAPGPAAASRNGVPLLPARQGTAAPITMALVNRLRDE